MKKNLGTADRVLRGVGADVMITCAAVAPFSLAVRAIGFGLTGAYLFFTAVAGTCLGYSVMGKSTCAGDSR